MAQALAEKDCLSSVTVCFDEERCGRLASAKCHPTLDHPWMTIELGHWKCRLSTVGQMQDYFEEAPEQ